MHKFGELNPLIGASFFTALLLALIYAGLEIGRDHTPHYQTQYAVELAEAAKADKITTHQTFSAIMGPRLRDHIAKGRYNSVTHPIQNWKPANGEFTVSRALLHAIMHQESRFKPRARSHRGAYGVMQIMPQTANYIIRKARLNEVQIASTSMVPVRVPNISARTLHQPEVNMAVGQAYLEYLAEKPYIQGDIVRLLAAYNAGPGAVQNWVERKGELDQEAFAKSIPYKETRDYVQKVMANYWVYASMMGEEPSLTLQ